MKRNDTVQALYEIDSRQTFALRPFEEDVDLMERWLSELEMLARKGVTEANFSPTRWAESAANKALKKELKKELVGTNGPVLNTLLATRNPFQLSPELVDASTSFNSGLKKVLQREKESTL